jgi:hypothetical protein
MCAVYRAKDGSVRFNGSANKSVGCGPVGVHRRKLRGVRCRLQVGYVGLVRERFEYTPESKAEAFGPVRNSVAGSGGVELSRGA